MICSLGDMLKFIGAGVALASLIFGLIMFPDWVAKLHERIHTKTDDED